MLLPETPVSTHVRVRRPCPQPVVRPTLLTVSPGVSPPSPTMVNDPAVSSERLLGPVVFAIPPSVKPTPLAPRLKLESDDRQTFPGGQPPILRWYDGSTISVPMSSAGT